jgi:hypothetical protein
MGVVDKMLELAEVKAGDVLYDLGSGDGRIVIRAARNTARAIGIEADSILVAKARAAAQAEGISHLVDFGVEEALKTDLSAATVVTFYILPWFNEAMKPNLIKYLKPGTRTIAHDFAMEGWEPDTTIQLPEPEIKNGGYQHYHTLFLWRIGK